MNDGNDRTQQLHHLFAEGADLPTVLTSRPQRDTAADVYSVSSRQDHVTLGRGAQCDVVLDDDRVSRLHAIVRLLGSRAVIEDAGSTNGTYVDGVLVEGKVELREGAMVRFGRRGPVFRYGRSLGTPSVPPSSGRPESTRLHRPPEFGRDH